MSTRAVLLNRWTGERFEVPVPAGVRAGHAHDLAVLAIVETHDGTPPADTWAESQTYLATLREELHAFQAWADTSHVGITLTTLADVLRGGCPCSALLAASVSPSRPRNSSRPSSSPPRPPSAPRSPGGASA